jgi:hypothetical protein
MGGKPGAADFVVFLLLSVPYNKLNMKKLFFCLMLAGFCVTAAVAQTTPKKKVETSAGEVKVKPTSTPTQKVHNVIHPKHKKYSGVKAKAKTSK